MNWKLVPWSLVLILFLGMVPGDPVGAENRFLRQGIEQYNLENYEESIPLLLKARQSEPESGAAAFFTGMAYKQTLDFPQAARHLRDAATMEPAIRESLVELVDVLIQAGQIQEAGEWIQTAERENIEPGKVAFLKGLMFRKQGMDIRAVEAFEKAGRVDPSLAQSRDIQIALILMKQGKNGAAKERLEAAVLHDPDSDLASFARHYLSLTESRIDIKPLRLAVSVLGQYDSNVVLEPGDSDAASGISNEQSTVVAARVRVDYIPVLQGPWLFNAQYSFAGDFHHHHSTTHDIVTNDFYVAPGYDFGKFAGYWIGMYKHSLVRDPGYKTYLESYATGPMLRFAHAGSHIFEFFPSYTRKNFHRSPYLEDEDRDADRFAASLGWVWLFRKNAFFNLRCEYVDEDTDGDNWDFTGGRLTLNSTAPLTEKLNFHGGCEIFLQYFENTHSVFGKKREDDLYRGFVGLSWEFLKNTRLVLDFTMTRVDSNLAVYDYDRYVVSAGVEYRY